MYGFAEPQVLKKNLTDNKALLELFPLGDDEQPNEEFLKKSVHMMFYELDKDHDTLEKAILKLVEDINKIEKD